jgi:hypothetical protein
VARWLGIPDTYTSMGREIAPLYTADSGSAWFWETTFRTVSQQDASGATLFADGVSTSDGRLAYGPELFTLFRAWAEIVRTQDRHAEFQTLWVAL